MFCLANSDTEARGFLLVLNYLTFGGGGTAPKAFHVTFFLFYVMFFCTVRTWPVEGGKHCGRFLSDDRVLCAVLLLAHRALTHGSDS